MINILKSYKQHLDKIEDTLLKAFQVVRNQTRFEIVEAIKVGRN